MYADPPPSPPLPGNVAWARGWVDPALALKTRGTWVHGDHEGHQRSPKIRSWVLSKGLRFFWIDFCIFLFLQALKGGGPRQGNPDLVLQSRPRQGGSRLRARQGARDRGEARALQPRGHPVGRARPPAQGTGARGLMEGSSWGPTGWATAPPIGPPGPMKSLGTENSRVHPGGLPSLERTSPAQGVRSCALQCSEGPPTFRPGKGHACARLYT